MAFGTTTAANPQLVGSCTSGRAASCAPNDHSVPSAGNDGISSLRWGPAANHLVSSNWDGGVRCWEVQESGGQVRAMPKAQGESLSLEVRGWRLGRGEMSLRPTGEALFDAHYQLTSTKSRGQ